MGILRWLVSGIFVVMSLSSFAVQVKSDAPSTYTVKKGDTLWSIAAMYLDSPWFWPELWRGNTDISNPHLIYPGDILTLSQNDEGEPVLTVESKPELVLTPEGEKIRKLPPVPTIAPETIRPFVEDLLVVDVAAYEQQPRVLGDYNGQVMYASDDVVLVEAYSAMTDHVVLRKQGELKDMQGNVLGVQGRLIADVTKLDDGSERHHLVEVSEASYEAIQGDRVVPRTWLPELTTLSLQPAAGDVKGFVIDNFQDHKLMGKYDIVVIDLGDGGVSPGTVMGLYNDSTTIDASETKPRYIQEGSTLLLSDDQLHKGPAIKVGEMIVFQTFERVSYGLIVQANDFIQRGTRVGRP